MMNKKDYFLQNELSARKMITGEYIRSKDETAETTAQIFALLEDWYADYKTQIAD